MRRFSGEQTPFEQMIMQKRSTQQQQKIRWSPAIALQSASLVPQKEKEEEKIKENDGECRKNTKSGNDFLLPSIAMHSYSQSTPPSPQYMTSGEEDFHDNKSCYPSSGHNRRDGGSSSGSDLAPPTLEGSTGGRLPAHASFPSSSSSVFMVDAHTPNRIATAGGKRTLFSGSSKANHHSRGVGGSLCTSFSLSLPSRHGKVKETSMPSGTGIPTVVQEGERGTQRMQIATGRRDEGTRSNGIPRTPPHATTPFPVGRGVAGGGRHLCSAAKAGKEEKHGAQAMASEGVSQEDMGSLLSSLQEMEKREKKSPDPTITKTRPVPYTITNETTKNQLIQIIHTLQTELDARTLSVNAIQRNFERLAAMYQANVQELEILREGQGKCMQQEQSEMAAQKVLGAMRVELEKQMEECAMTKAKLETQRAEAQANEQKLQSEAAQVQELLQHRIEEVRQHQWMWAKYEEEKETWMEKQRERLVVAMDSIKETLSVQHQEEMERLQCNVEREREKERMMHREALQGVLREAILIWKQLPQRTLSSSSDVSNECPSFEQGHDLFAEALEKICEPSSSSTAGSALLSSSSSLFSLSHPSISTVRKENEGQGNEEREEQAEKNLTTSRSSTWKPFGVREDAMDRLEYWASPLRSLLRTLRAYAVNVEQESTSRREYGVQEHPYNRIGHFPLPSTIKEEKQTKWENAIALQRSQWMHMIISILTEAEEKSRRMLEVFCFHFYPHVCHNSVVAFQELWLTFSRSEHRKDQQIQSLSMELDYLQKSSKEDRGNFEALNSLEIDKLKEKIALLESKAHTHMQKIFLLEQERDQLKEAIHIITLNAENKKKRRLNQEGEYSRKVEAERTELNDQHAAALRGLRKELEDEKEKMSQQHLEETCALRRRAMEVTEESERKSNAGTEAMVALLARVEHQKNALFEELVDFTVVKEEEGTRQSMMEVETFSRGVHLEFFRYSWKHRRASVCRKQCSELIQQESAARTALRIEEIASCTKMVFYISSAAAKAEDEKRWKREREEVLGQLDALRQRLHNKDKEHFILQERCAQMEKTMLQHQNDLKERDILQAKYDILEEQLHDVQHRQIAEVQNVEKMHKVALSSVQCLIVAEEASESSYSCPLCLQLFRHPLTCSPCGHTFCEVCIHEHPKNMHHRRRPSPPGSPLANKEVCADEAMLGYYCPECRAHTVSSLLHSTTLDTLSSKFEYRKKVLRDILALLHQS